MFRFGKKKNNPDNLKRLYKKTDMIPFFVDEEYENNIILGKKDDLIFVAFKDEKISDFLKAWYPILKMRINNEISKKYYDSFINSVLEEYGSIKNDSAKNKEEIIEKEELKNNDNSSQVSKNESDSLDDLIDIDTENLNRI